MSTTAGTLSQVSVASDAVIVTTTEASGGTGPYTHQLHMSTVSGFTPGSGNVVTGATSLTNTVTGLTANTTYYFVDTATDSGSVSANSNQVTVVTPASYLPNQNQFEPSPMLGQTDLRFNYATESVIIDDAQTTPLYTGSAVKQVAGVGAGPRRVIGCTADSDDCIGFINYNSKQSSFSAYQACEISTPGNVLYLMPTVTGTLPCKAQLDILTPGGVAPVVGSSGAEIVGDFMDTPTAGIPARVKLGAQVHTKA